MVNAIRVESLSDSEARALIRQVYSDYPCEAHDHDSLDSPATHKAKQLAAEARSFYKAWINHTGNSADSMAWALNNEALPYRLHLIPLLVGMRLHDTS